MYSTEHHSSLEYCVAVLYFKPVTDSSGGNTWECRSETTISYNLAFPGLKERCFLSIGENARSHAGKIVLSIISKLIDLNLVRT